MRWFSVVVVGSGGGGGDSRRRSFVCSLLHLAFFEVPRALHRGFTCRVFLGEWRFAGGGGGGRARTRVRGRGGG